MEFFGNIEGATVTCEPKYGFLPCTSETWGALFLYMVYQYLMALGQKYVSEGSDKFFGLIGPGIFGASLFHILANFPTLFLVLQSALSSEDGGASSTTSSMNTLTGSMVMSLTIIWPSVITFGSYDLSDDDDDSISSEEEEPSFFKKLTAYGVTTDNETSYTARIMLVSAIPFYPSPTPNNHQFDINNPSDNSTHSHHCVVYVHYLRYVSDVPTMDREQEIRVCDTKICQG